MLDRWSRWISRCKPEFRAFGPRTNTCVLLESRDSCIDRLVQDSLLYHGIILSVISIHISSPLVHISQNLQFRLLSEKITVLPSVNVLAFKVLDFSSLYNVGVLLLTHFTPVGYCIRASCRLPSKLSIKRFPRRVIISLVLFPSYNIHFCVENDCLLVLRYMA
jgi:hypothetical protein